MLQSTKSKKLFLLGGGILLIMTMWLGGVAIIDTLHELRLIPNILNTTVRADGNLNIWWPTDGAKVSDLQAFKGMVQNKNVSEYSMTWSVDNGQQNAMYNSYADYPHKEAAVDLKNWTWRGNGPYKVTFRAADKSGASLGETSVNIYTPGPAQGPVTVEAAKPTDTTSVIKAVTTSASVQVTPVSVAPATNTTVTQATSQTVNVWWPTNNAVVTGTQPFKAVVNGMSVDSYKMYWQVDGDRLNEMYTSQTDAPHKEAWVNVSGWNWRGNGPYTLTFVAQNSAGSVIAKQNVVIATGAGAITTQPSTVQSQPVQTQPTQTTQSTSSQPVASTQPTAPAPTQSVAPASSGNPLGGVKLYVNPNSPAKQQADAWQSSRPADAAQMDKIAQNPSAIWLGGWNADISGDVRNAVNAAASQGAVPTFIAYNIPFRDCGQYSAGGVNDTNAYRAWIQKIADAIGGKRAVVILEPDALTLTSCLSQSQTQDRFSAISSAISTLKSKGAIVYVDAGHPGWIPANDMANRLNQAGVAKADGFALNVSNFTTTSDNIAYGQDVSRLIGGKHFVIDTSRNGVGPTPDNQWCNPSGRALGYRPTTNTGNSLVDAFLWLKTPGESDGNCNGGPSAGTWWPEYALDLARRAAY